MFFTRQHILLEAIFYVWAVPTAFSLVLAGLGHAMKRLTK